MELHWQKFFEHGVFMVLVVLSEFQIVEVKGNSLM